MKKKTSNSLYIGLGALILLVAATAFSEVNKERKIKTKRDNAEAEFSSVKLPDYLTLVSTARGGDGKASDPYVRYVYNSTNDMGKTFDEIKEELAQEEFKESKNTKLSDETRTESSFINLAKQLKLHVLVLDSGRVDITATKEVEA
jgi:hypothetical protein